MLPQSKPIRPIKPRPRSLLLNLIGSRGNVKMNAANAVRVGALFGISENNVRVTLTRLVSSHLLKIVERGDYQLGEKGQQLAKQVNAWREAESSLCDWQGDWVVATTNGLGKTNRSALRIRQRALHMMGMQQLIHDLYVRPSNFAQGTDFVRSRLLDLGLEPTAPVFRASDFASDLQQKAKTLWDVNALETCYRQGLQELEDSLERLPTLALDEAAKESYLVGDNALQQLVFDPLLPAPLADVALRQQFRNKVREYDEVGERIWFRFLAQ